MSNDDFKFADEAYSSFEAMLLQGKYDDALEYLTKSLRDSNTPLDYCRLKFEESKVMPELYLKAYLSLLDEPKFIAEFEGFLESHNANYLDVIFQELAERALQRRDILEEAFQIFLKKVRSINCNISCRGVFLEMQKSDPNFSKTLGPQSLLTRRRLIESPLPSVGEMLW